MLPTLSRQVMRMVATGLVLGSAPQSSSLSVSSTPSVLTVKLCHFSRGTALVLDLNIGALAKVDCLGGILKVSRGQYITQYIYIYYTVHPICAYIVSMCTCEW